MDVARDFLARLSDPRLFEVRDPLPVFAMHTRYRKRPDGTSEPDSVDEARLRRVVANYQRLAAQGVLPRMTLGHIHLARETPERAQPPIVGYWRDLRLGTWQGKPAIWATPLYDRSKTALLREDGGYPYRSAEYYPGREEITGIALLRRDPDLDLGMATYGRNDEPVYYYTIEATMPDASEARPAATATPPPASSVPDAKPAPDPTAPPDAAAPGAAELEHHMRCMRAAYPHLHALHEHMSKGGSPATFAPAGVPPMQHAMPGATNMAPPAGAPPVPAAPGPETYARGTLPDQFARLNAEFQQLKADRVKDKETIAGLTLDREVAVCRKIVADLVNVDGVHIRNVEKEVMHLARMDEPSRAARILELQENYERDPTKGERINVVDPDGDRTGEPNERELEQATQYMRTEGLEFAAAVAKVRSNGKK